MGSREISRYLSGKSEKADRGEAGGWRNPGRRTTEEAGSGGGPDGRTEREPGPDEEASRIGKSYRDAIRATTEDKTRARVKSAQNLLLISPLAPVPDTISVSAQR